MITRRSLLETAGATVALAGGHAVFPGLVEAEPAVPNMPAALPQGTRSEVVMDALPGKKPLIKSHRPPNYETPLEYFRTRLTPNDAFFVRYHLADIPEVDATKWRLTVGGEAANSEATLSLDDLKKMPAAEVVAVNQCSGNRRGLFEPHVPGIEWGYGAMGCARWKGVRLKDISTRSESRKMRSRSCWTALTDLSSTRPRSSSKAFRSSKAMEDTALVAYEMNGSPLPHFNGFPARVVIPAGPASIG